MHPWFEEAKLGIFIHWGIYAVKGVAESWSFYHNRISYEEYMNQCEGFTASAYDPKAWAQLFFDAGARYAVLTAKHHDGVSLWDTQHSDLNVVKKTKAKRDLIKPYCDSLKEKGLRVGLYYSHSDWSHPDYPSIYRPDERDSLDTLVRNKHVHPEGEEDWEAWERYLTYHRGQLTELVTQFGPVDLLWFDGDWEKSAEQWRARELREYLQRISPSTILNSRMQGYGDYATPEQAIPIIPPKGPWEYCVTMNDSWGYQHRDTNYKSARQIIQMFCEIIGMGGNLLLDIGPKEDGSIPEEQRERLLTLGQWIKGHEEAIYPTTAGLPFGHFYGPTTLSRDKKSLYLFLFNKPQESISLKGIRNKIQSISVLKTGKELTYERIGGAPWLNVPGVMWIHLTEKDCDPYVTVIKLELTEPLDLYRESGQAITMN